MQICFSKLREVYLESIAGDGIGNILFYRPIAIVLSAFFVRLGFAASVISFFSLLSNMEAAYQFFSGNFFWGMVFFHLGNILDCSDGQVALWTDTKSKLGGYFDAWIDRVSYIVIFGSIVFEYYIRSENSFFLGLYLLWIVFFFSNTYCSKVSTEISEKQSLVILQEKSQKFLGKFSRYIRWDGTVTAVIFHVCLFAGHLEWVIVPFILWHGLLSIGGAKNIFQKLYRKNEKNM